MESTPRESARMTIPGAIIIAAAIIGIAIIVAIRPARPIKDSTAAVTQAQMPSTNADLAPVSDADHILGDPNAPVKIIEYSDPSCPFCKVFYPTMKKIMDQYGADGKVAWIYRSFPLDKPDDSGHILHPNAGHESEALECAAAQGGNSAFWKYTNRLYDITPSVTQDTPSGLDQKLLPEIAKYVGLDVAAFNDCLDSGRFKNKIESDYLSGVNAGVTGTPYSFILTPSGSKIPIEGIQSYSALKSAIDALLSQSS